MRYLTIRVLAESREGLPQGSGRPAGRTTVRRPYPVRPEDCWRSVAGLVRMERIPVAVNKIPTTSSTAAGYPETVTGEVTPSPVRYK
jgi:hypothetical protein